MSKLIRFEFDKLFRRLSLYILALVGVGLAVINGLTYMAMSSVKIEGMSINTYHSAWQFAAGAVSNSSLTMLMGIFIAMFVCSEVEEGTLKNIYARGYSRDGVYISTYIASLLGTLILYAAAVAACFTIGAILWGVGDMGMYLASIGTQVVILIAYHTIFYALSVIISRNGFAIAVNIVLPLIMSLIAMLADQLVNVAQNGLTPSADSSIKVSHFWLDSLILYAEHAADSVHLLICCGASAAYVLVFFVLGLSINKTKQV